MSWLSEDAFEAAGAVAREKAAAAAEAGSAAVEKERSRREAGREEPVPDAAFSRMQQAA